MSTDDITITAIDPPGPSVTGKATDVPAVPTGAEDWAFDKRPRRTSYTWWAGHDGYTMSVPILFDNFLADTGSTWLSIEGTLEVLRRIQRTPVGPRNEPAVVAVTGATVPLTWLTWVIQDITYGDMIRDPDTGHRARQAVVVTLLQYAGADVIAGPAETANKLASGAASLVGGPGISGIVAAPGVLYTVRSGDTLMAIAQRLLGDSTRWHDIADLNGVRDPYNITPGQVLQIPA